MPRHDRAATDIPPKWKLHGESMIRQATVVKSPRPGGSSMPSAAGGPLTASIKMAMYRMGDDTCSVAS